MTETLAPAVSVEETFRQFSEEIQAQMERLHVPGVAVGVLCEGKEYVTGFGVTNIEHPLPVDPDTLFQIGSTSKTFTGTLIMQLVEAGKIDLDATVRTYIPDLKLADEDVAARVTVRHLVTHMGGWLGDFFADEGRGDDALARVVAKMAEVEQLTPLGELWSYSNSSFYLLGRIIELVTGKSFEAACQEMLLDPLGLSMSFYFAKDVMPLKFVVGHRVKDDQPEVLHPWALPRNVHAAGGIISTVKDQLKYARFHLDGGATEGGARLLSKESMELMQSPLAKAGSFAEQVGVTWYLRNVDGITVVQHGGTTNGQLSAFMFVPERGFAVTVLTNADKGGELHGEATRWAFQHFLGLNDAVPAAIEASEEQLAPYVGTYSAKTMDATITLDEGKLLVSAVAKRPAAIAADPKKPGAAPPPIPPFHAALSGEDRAVALDPPFKNALLEFIRSQEGEIVWLRLGGRILRRKEAEAPSEFAETFELLCQRVEVRREELKVPGLALGITFQGTEFIRTFGVTNIRYSLPVEEDTLFQIGSTTKTITATAVMRLVEMGKLELDQPIRRYLPELKLSDEEVTSHVTMRHLLTHTGGWVGDFFDDTGSGDDALRAIVEKMAELEQLTPLGEIYSYNNSGFYLAGRVIEALTEQPYETAIQELVLDPLGMTSSFFMPEDVISRGFAVGHNVSDVEGGVPKVEVALPVPLPRAVDPAGGLSSSVKDQLRYARFHLGDGTIPDGVRLLSEESMKLMQSPQAPAAEGGSVGLSWRLRDIGGLRLVSHGGGTIGQISSFDMVPGRQFAITCLTNANRGGQLTQEVVDWALEHFLDVKEDKPQPIEMQIERLPEYAGRYETEMSILTLELRDAELVLEMGVTDKYPADEPPPLPPPTRIVFYGEDRIMALDGPLADAKGEFIRGPAGDIAWLRMGGRLHRSVS